MKSIDKQPHRKAAFTIIELLTVMSIMVILIGILVPALNKVRRYAKEVKQKGQFHSIGQAIELFYNDYDGYPPSGALDRTGQPYCGAMKLCEAMMGQDLLGFHPDSVFRADGMDLNETRQIYTTNPDNLAARMGPFLELDNANAYRLVDIYGQGNTGAFNNEETFVLCDVYTNQVRTGMKVGMPILYYKAETANNLHYDPDDPDSSYVPTRENSNNNIYNFYDNEDLVLLGKPWEPLSATPEPHNLTMERFYKNTQNYKITTIDRPFRSDSYILISAGFDGEYGTADDICNFEWKYQEL